MSRLEQFDAATLGDRLRTARTAAGLTQSRAATAVGLGRTTLVAIERGERRVRPRELVDLADLYGTSVSSLVSANAVQAEVRGHFRAQAASDDARGRALGLLVRLASGYVELERAVGRPLRPHVLVPEYPARGGSSTHAEDAATLVRSLLGLGVSPISDLLSLAELQLGLRVFIRALDSKVSGAYAFHPELGGCVLVNARHPTERRAWTLAHEIGHFVGEREHPDVVLRGEESDDKFADAFAGALLMPPAALRRRFQDLEREGGKFSARDLILSAREYRVSLEAMCRWLERLNLLPSQTYEALRERGLNASVVAAVAGEAKADEIAEVPPRLLMIAAESYHRGFATEGQLVDLLGISRLTVREMLDGVPPDAFDHLG